MKLLIINPNTSDAITARVLGEARRIASRDTELKAVTGRFGARYVASRAAYAIAGHAALEAYAEHAADADAVLLACFGDPGLFALKELARQPVVGMAEASCLTAAALGGRFSIVTGGERWAPMLEEFVASIGLRERLAAIETVAPSGADIARDPDGALNMLADACTEAVARHRADSVILAGAGLVGLAARIAHRVPAPLVDCLAASLRMAETLARANVAKPERGSFAATPPVETVGLAPALAAMLEKGGV